MLKLLLFTIILAIVFFCALGLTLWLTGVSVAAGATLFAIGAFGALLWLVGSIFSHMDAAEPSYFEIDKPTASAESLSLIMTQGPDNVREWESLAETKSWFNSDCAQSRAIYSRRHNGTVGVRNVCMSHRGKVKRDIEGEARATDLPGTLTVSFFPGFVSQYVVRKYGDNFLMVTNKDSTQGWLLHAVDDKNVSDDAIKTWRRDLRAAVDGHVVDIPRSHTR